MHIGFQRQVTPIPGSACPLLVRDDQQLSLTINPAGVQKFSFLLPPVLGVTVHFQVVTLAPVPGGVMTTNGVTVEVPN